MPLHHTGSALAFADTGHVDDVSFGEGVGVELLAEAVLAGVAGPDLHQMLARRHPGLLKVPGAGLGQLLGLDGTEAELDGRVTVDIGGSNLGNDAWPCLDHGDWDNAVAVVPELCHAELGAQQALDVCVLSWWRSSLIVLRA